MQNKTTTATILTHSRTSQTNQQNHHHNTNQTVATTLERLYLLSAVDRSMRLTAAGRRMAEFPIDPMHAKTLVEAAELGCADEVLLLLL